MLEPQNDFLTITKAFDYNYLLLLLMYAIKIILLFNLNTERRQRWVYPLHILAAFVFLFLFNLAHNYIFGTPTAMLFASVLFCLIGYAALVKTHKLRTSIMLISIYYSTEMCVTMLIGSLRPIISLMDRNDTMVVMEGVIRFVLTSSTILIPFLLNWHDIERMMQVDSLEDRYLPIILIYNFLTVVVALTGSILRAFSSAWQGNVFFAIIVYIGFILSNLFSYYLIGRISEVQQSNTELLTSKIRLESRISTVQVNQKNLEELRKIRHDIKNQIIYMNAMVEEGRYSDLKEFLSDYEANLLRKTDSVDCGNPVLNSILTFEQAKAQEAGLRIQMKLLVPPELPFKEMDLCSILTNVLDNAIEGTLRNGQTDPIELSISFKQDSFLYISIVNSVGTASRESLFKKTSKTDDMSHGYGTKIVRSIVRQYNGEMVRNVSDGKFIVDIMLDTLYKEKQA